jgi:hypothetical protein
VVVKLNVGFTGRASGIVVDQPDADRIKRPEKLWREKERAERERN